jgi:hypothetical protein
MDSQCATGWKTYDALYHPPPLSLAQIVPEILAQVLLPGDIREPHEMIPVYRNC